MGKGDRDPETIKKEVRFYYTLGGKSYKISNNETVVHFLHLGQLEEYFNATNNMPILSNTKENLFLINNYYDIYNPETGEERTSTPDEALEVYIQEYINTGFIGEDTLVLPEWDDFSN